MRITNIMNIPFHKLRKECWVKRIIRKVIYYRLCGSTDKGLHVFEIFIRFTLTLSSSCFAIFTRIHFTLLTESSEWQLYDDKWT